ncbi:MAG TPA: hypothetical protein V6D22_01800 [Candidatus Obscuribacterales bacterium]
MWQQGRDLWNKLTGRERGGGEESTASDRGGRQDAEPRDPHDFDEAQLNPCCDQPNVHIAFRGKADDRLYMAYNRQWHEMRFYQKNGLRVFCAKCRRRLY